MARVLTVISSLVLAGSMVALVVGLSSVKNAGRAAIERYVVVVRRGEPTAHHAGSAAAAAEAEALHTALARTESFGVDNFQSQEATSCFWVTLHVRGGRDVDAAFLLHERGDTDEVVEASLSRECDCPDSDDPCGFR